MWFGLIKLSLGILGWKCNLFGQGWISELILGTPKLFEKKAGTEIAISLYQNLFNL